MVKKQKEIEKFNLWYKNEVEKQRLKAKAEIIDELGTEYVHVTNLCFRCKKKFSTSKQSGKE